MTQPSRDKAGRGLIRAVLELDPGELVRGGLIVRFEQFVDTAKVTEAARAN